MLMLAAAGCGKGKINLDNASYDPKITVEGYLYPGQGVSNIMLMRNFPLGDSLNPDELYLSPSTNGVSATINGTALNFDEQRRTYFNNLLITDYGKAYTLEVHATIDGTPLHLTSTTTTPQKGFSVLSNQIGKFSYGDSIAIEYLTSPGTGFYSFSIVPDTASTANFIYSNHSFRKKLDSSDVATNLNQYKYRYGTVDNINSLGGISYTYRINSRNTLFYSTYTVVAYACDENMKDYILTSTNVQEIDGNFHEPVETFQGSGIGVFGSAIADTVRFSIVR